jgi:3-oxoacyl-[acyl-carrier protein] reductase
MTAVLTEEQNQRIAGNVPAGRLGVSAEIAAAVVYFASEEAAYTTGATLHVNGGLAML